jgi:hypothetical protein
MSHFRQRLLTQHGFKHLFFYSYHSYLGLSFHLSVCGKVGPASIYELKSKEGHWKLEDPDNCPGWLTAMEEALSEAITAHQAE